MLGEDSLQRLDETVFRVMLRHGGDLKAARARRLGGDGPDADHLGTGGDGAAGQESTHRGGAGKGNRVHRPGERRLAGHWPGAIRRDFIDHGAPVPQAVGQRVDGLGLVADGTGVLLNNELDDFNARPGAANAYGLVGFNANLPGPGKRPLSSMTPTIVLKGGEPFLITGSPGGSRTITAVLQVITNVIDFHMPVAQAVSAPRLHHQWEPDKTYVEPGFAPALLDALRERGHTIVPAEPHTAANSIEVTANGYVGAADRRTRGATAAGY